MLKHFETILIYPESAFRVKSIEHFEVDSHIRVSLILSSISQWIQLYIKFNHVVEIWREAHSNFGSLFRLRIIKTKGPLFDEFAILVKSIFLDLTKLYWSWLVPSRLEYVLTLTGLRFQLLSSIVFCIVTPRIIALFRTCHIVNLL